MNCGISHSSNIWGHLEMEDEKFGLIFRRISHAAKKDTDNYLKKWDLTMSQAMVLEYLNNTPDTELTQRAIEQHFNLQHPTVSGILKRLEKNAYIETATSETDRRVKKIFMTEKAKQIDIRAKQRQAETEELLVKGLTTEEIETLRRLLENVLKNITSE